MELRNAVGILTGASRGIGLYLADALAAAGVDLALAARTPGPLDETAQRVRARGRRAIAVPTDITSVSDLERLVARTSSELGVPTLLVNNAGREMVGYFERLDLDEIDRTIATNVGAVVTLSRLVVGGMLERGRGHICNIASAAGKAARPYGVVYSATKHAVVGFSWSLRAELAPKGVEVSVVCPGYVSEVGMFADRVGADQRPPRALGWVSPQDVARATVDAIERNRAEVVVAPALVRTSDLFHALSPELAIRTGRRTGLYDYLRKEATGDGPA